MKEKFITTISSELKITSAQVLATAGLLAEGATVPFIARYRKERTGQLDEVAITAIRDRLIRLQELEERREAIVKSLAERNLLTDELGKKIESAATMSALEDIYLPFRPKRRTRAMIARERGLEPLATLIFAQEAGMSLEKAGEFVDAEKEVPDAESALAGARDIIAEWISENAEARREMRALFESDGTMTSKVVPGSEEKGAKFRDYFDCSEPVVRAPSHRVLAMFRGEKEGFLYLRLQPDEGRALDILRRRFVRGAGPCADQVRMAAEDSYSRLLSPSMETETRLSVRERAGTEAIKVFADNLRELLMAPPLGQKSVMAIDPGFRTGCKLVCLDPQGKLLGHTVIYISASDREIREAAEIVKKLCSHFKIEAIAIGNGTASRETETFIKAIKLPPSIAVVVVNESGASVYSASEVAREEFPDYDLTVRGAVSIGRRLTDPLAELVKIDPKAIGVGQYQHDVNQTELKKCLDDVVMACVNSVGVEANTASRQLLSYVSGLGDGLAKKIVDYRNENGPFKSRSELKKVPRLGSKAYEQAAGFLRIRGARNPLDSSAVHPESYHIVKKMAEDLGCTVSDLMKNRELRDRIKLETYVSDEVGMPTLADIMQELARPGRDPRDKFEVFSFADGVHEMQDLAPGMKLPGIVTNVTNFGAFVDIGVHQDGLVHVSELADKFVSDPKEVVKVHQKVQVTVMEVDLERKRISLSMRSSPGSGRGGGQRQAQRPAQRRTFDTSLGSAFGDLKL